MSNSYDDFESPIVTHDKYNARWYKKIMKTDAKPSEKAYHYAKLRNHKIIVSRQINMNRVYGSYKDIQTVEKVINRFGNIHLYELLRPDTPLYLYLDIEFPKTDKDPKDILTNTVEFIRNIFIEIYGKSEAFDYEDIYVSGSIGMGKLRNVEVEKCSYHIIINTSSIFKNMNDLRIFMNYVKYRVFNDNVEDMTYTLNDTKESVIDFQVYGKNQNMKLPKQSKYGSNRVQAPLNTDERLYHHFCGVYENRDDYDYYDISKIPVHSNIKKTTNKDKKQSGCSYGGIYQDFMARNVVVDAPYSSSVKYLVDSIDNKDQCYNVWFGVCCAIKNSGEPYSVFEKWSKRSNKHDDDECINLWNSIKRTSQGYNKGTLYNLASLCNDKIKDKKNENELVIETLTKVDTKIKTITYNEEFQRPYPYNEYRTIIAKSPMATGKTYQIKKMLKDIDISGLKVLVLAPRRLFARSICGDIIKAIDDGTDPLFDGFKVYLDVDKRHKNLKKCQHLVCQMESLHYLEADYDILIADEFVSCLTQFSSVETMKRNIDKNARRFMDIWKVATHRIVCDAFIDPKTIKFVENIERVIKPKTIVDFFKHEEKDEYPDVLYMINERLPVRRKAIEYDEPEFVEKLTKSIVAGKKCVFVSARKKFGYKTIQHIKQFKPNLRYEYYNADNKDNEKHLTDVNKHWADLDLLVYTSSITVGVNFDLPDVYDELYVSTASCLSHVRDMFQASMRVRHITSNTMHYHLIEDKWNCFKIGNPNMDEINQEIDDRINREARSGEMLRKNAVCEDIIEEWKVLDEWLRQVHVYNVFERNTSCHMHRKLFNHYLKINNYYHADKELDDGVELERVEDAEGLKPPEIFIPYDEMDLSLYDYDELKRRSKNDLTDRQKNALQKFKFDEQVKSGEKRGEMYDFYHNPEAYKKGLYFNMLYEVRYGDRIEDLRRKEQKDAVFAEFSREKSIKLQIIKEILGIIKTKSTTNVENTINADALESSYDTIMDNKERWFNVFNIRNQADKSKKKPPKLREIVKVISPIIKSWSGSSFKRVQRKQKQVNGVRKDCSIFGFVPELKFDVIGMFSDNNEG